MSDQYVAIDDTAYVHFAANDTSGSGGDGASAAVDVRLCGAAASAAPIAGGATVSLLSHASYPPGAYEVALVVSVANGYAANNVYAVFCTLAVDSQNPTGFIGRIHSQPVIANTTQVSGTGQTANDNGADINAILVDTAVIGAAGAGLTAINLPDQTMNITGNITGNLSGSVGSVTGAVGSVTGAVGSVSGHTVQTGDTYALANGATGFAAIDTVVDAILVDTNELQGDWANGGRLDLLLDAIPTTAMRGTDNAATAAALATAQIDLDTITGSDGVTLATAQGNYAPATPAQVNTEMVDVMATDTVALPGQGAPPNTPTRDQIAGFLYKSLRNKQDENKTTGVHNLYADDGTTVDQKATHTDDGTTFTKGEFESGP